ncbi:DNA-directed RNA polymerase subunit beta', partial [Candidatus Dojkabacteria bacterium]|nr:DNA-directed RNA polymerase subunit beta' [Candidatus Dojkabacteria bacterium]
LEGLEKNNIDPAWMILKVIPVLPPDLRPIIPLSGGKFATHDLNDLYRRIINRNNRLNRLIEIGAPEIILRNEKRMLQESVDALIDNQHRPSKPMLNSKRLPYNSLTDQLRGKKGIFRKNLLGKRVDYSGRAVIVGDAKLEIHQCGLPKSVTLEIFKPFVIHELLDRELAPNIKIAREIIENGEEVVWDVLEEIIENKPVILNRAPTLHKYSIQTFYPKLVEGEAIHLHPLVCKAYNADFDGDQMAVHVLLTDEAIQEGVDKMMSSRNIVSIANGKILANPSKDMLLGYFLLTDMHDVEKPKYYGSFNEAVKAYQREKITVDEKIVVKSDEEVLETSVGRIIFNSILPEDYEFVNKRIGGAEIGEILEDVSNSYPREYLLDLLDTLKTIGFKYATDLGFTFAMEDCTVDIDMRKRIQEMEEKDSQLEENYSQGLITEDEKVNLSVNMWNDFADEVAEEAWEKLDENNSVYEMVQSKANGGKIQMRQVVTIKGVVRDSQGNWIPLPIKGNYRDGLSGFEYFVAANGGRKGQADQSLRTSSAGYLTRKLVDVAHSVIIRQDDCGYEGEGIKIERDADRRLSFEDRLYGRVVTSEVKDSKGKTLVEANEAITRDQAETIAGMEDVASVNVRTPLFCKSPLGICQKCYGYNIESGSLIGMGTAVGVIAAQSIGEPGTQLTMRTFHMGGVEKTDITQGLPRVEELLEARTPKTEAEIAKFDGKAHVEKQDDDSHTIIITGKKEVEKSYVVSYAKKVLVNDGDTVKNGDVIFIDQEEKEKQASYPGKVKVDHGVLTINGLVEAEEVITVLPDVGIIIEDGDSVDAGQQLTEGSIDPKKLAENAGIAKAQEYIIDGVQKVFNEQGVALADVHFEVIVRQMARLARVLDPGDSNYLVGTLINRFIADVKNEIIREEDKNISLFVPKLLGIKASALYTESFLSAMSFQEQVRVLTNASLLGKVDYLRGMKENVIIGKRIPVGEGAEIEDIGELEEVKMF